MSLFNPDGSIKLPNSLQKEKENEKRRLTQGFCVKIRKDIVSDRSPKSCRLSLTLSQKLDNSFIDRIYEHWHPETPTKINKISDKEICIDIGTTFSRCKDCQEIIDRIRSSVDGNLIEDKGTCTSKKKEKEFCYEDFFD